MVVSLDVRFILNTDHMALNTSSRKNEMRLCLTSPYGIMIFHHSLQYFNSHVADTWNCNPAHVFPLHSLNYIIFLTHIWMLFSVSLQMFFPLCLSPACQVLSFNHHWDHHEFLFCMCVVYGFLVHIKSNNIKWPSMKFMRSNFWRAT